MFGLLKIFFKFYNRFFSPDKLFAKRLRSLVGFTPSNIGIFKLAFYHKSASSEKLYAVQSNERLEYLGDAVLGTIVAEYLFKKYPQKDEGFLTKMRSKIVKRQSLNKIADKMGLDVFLNQYNNTRLSRSMLGNALEALVGAVYIERGYNQTRQYVIQKILRGYLDIHELESFDDNYKSQLLEWCQKNGQTVSYKMLAKYKFEKRDRFKVAVLIDGKKLASADDFNKKSAEQTASEKAMQLLGLLKEEKEEGSDKRKSRHNSRNSHSSKPRENQKDNRRDNRNNSGNRKNSSRNKSQNAVKSSAAAKKEKSSAVAKKENSDWSDVKLDIPESGTKSSKDSGKGSKGNRSNRSSRSNASKKEGENRTKGQDKNTAKGNKNQGNNPQNNKPQDNKSQDNSSNEKAANSKQENKRKPAPRKPRPQVAKKEEAKQSRSSEQKKPETNKAPRIVKKKVEKPVKEIPVHKKENQERIASKQAEVSDPSKASVREAKSRTENTSRRNNSRRGRGRSSGEKSKPQNVDTDESVEIEIPVDLTRDIVEKVKPRIIKSGPDPLEGPPAV